MARTLNRKTPTTKAEARRYLNRALARKHLDACEHGHLDCALWDAGPCSNELAATFDIFDD